MSRRRCGKGSAPLNSGAGGGAGAKAATEAAIGSRRTDSRAAITSAGSATVAVVDPPPGFPKFPTAEGGLGGGGLHSATTAVGAVPSSSSFLPSVFLPGDPSLRLLQQLPAEEVPAAAARLAELVGSFDVKSPPAVAAVEAAAAAAETAAAAGLSSRGSALNVSCAVAKQLPLFPYKPGLLLARVQRYEPAAGDVVLGIVTSKSGEYYSVSIGACSDGLLPVVSGFEGATKQQKPQLRRGDVLFCQVSAVTAAIFQLTCKSTACKKPWHSDEKFFKQLHGGILLQIPVPLATSLMAPHCFVLEKLGERLAFECATGVNGFLWVKSHTAAEAVLVANILLASYGKERHVIQAIINTLLAKRRG